MRPSSEGERRRRCPAALGALALALALGGCQTMEQVRRMILPDQERVAMEPVTAPPKKIGGAQAGAPVRPAKPPPPAVPQARTTAPAPAAANATTPSSDLAALPPQATPPGPGPEAGRIVLIPPPGVEPVIRVGLLLPLSGPHAELGKSLLNAAQLALFEVAGQGFALLPVDTQGTAEGAAAAARRALDRGARLILGPVFAPSVAAVAPIAQAGGVQVVSFSNDRAVAGNGVYVMGFMPETQIRRVMTYARDRGLKRLVGLVPDGPYGDRVEQILRSLIPVLGLDLKTVARYRGQSTEALAPVIKRLANYDARRGVLLARRKELKAESDEASKRALKRLEKFDTLGGVDFDGVFLPQGGASLRALAPLLRFYDIDPRKVRVLGTVEWNDPILATEPALYGGWFIAPSPAARQGFETAYKKAFGSPAPPVASLAYDATSLAAVIARPPDPAAAPVARVAGAAARPTPVPPPSAAPGQVFTRHALTAANGFAGADGIFRLLPSGLVERGFAVMEVRERRFVVVSPAPLTFQRMGN
ncbi:MAG: penicillin-binding protein activator [Alphaproteobacteria bacterium]|nr:penicillin-binding protein activator [Alphaproteobacteria bacterium]MCZ6609259.1 penicillin-binding protein activator [Alphaproteobacteria bacterium]MCZ6849620.1 penicillin-binding protein activator [Alphaproteobacteria bacterium]